MSAAGATRALNHRPNSPATKIRLNLKRISNEITKEFKLLTIHIKKYMQHRIMLSVFTDIQMFC